MVLFNYATKEITAKIVYYGPGLCGKTTNLQFIFDSLPSNNKSKMLSLATKTDRTLFFDFLPLDIGKIRGMRTKLQLYTVPGQVYYNSTRQLVLKGADGVVFVADSQDYALDANLESLQNLEDNLKRQGIKIAEIPLVLQYNKRDLPNALPIEELERGINDRFKVPSYESVATTGLGVERTLKGITQLVLTHLVKKYGLEGAEPLEKEIHVLNPIDTDEAQAPETLWVDEPAPAPAAVSLQEGRDFVVEETGGNGALPLVSSELISGPTSLPAFEAVIESFEQAPPVEPPFEPFDATEVPIASVEIPLPEGILNSLPTLPPQQAAPAERRTNDGLIKELNLPVNLSLDELKRHRKLKLRITLDVNLLP